MTDNTNLPSVDEIFDYTLKELNVVRHMLSKTTSRLRIDQRPIGSPLTSAQSQARMVALAAINDATAVIDQAMGALHDALHADSP